MKLLNLIIGGLVVLSLIGCGKTSTASAYPDEKSLKKMIACHAKTNHSSNAQITGVSDFKIYQQYTDGNKVHIRYAANYTTNTVNPGPFTDYAELVATKNDNGSGEWIILDFLYFSPF